MHHRALWQRMPREHRKSEPAQDHCLVAGALTHRKEPLRRGVELRVSAVDTDRDADEQTNHEPIWSR